MTYSKKYYILKEDVMYKGWEGFNYGKWNDRVDVRDFIQRNYTEYTGDESFLAPATEATLKLWKMVMELSNHIFLL